MDAVLAGRSFLGSVGMLAREPGGGWKSSSPFFALFSSLTLTNLDSVHSTAGQFGPLSELWLLPCLAFCLGWLVGH